MSWGGTGRASGRRVYPHNIDRLLDLGVDDSRWKGSTPPIGAIMSNQPSIVQYLVDHGAHVRVRTTLG